MANTSRVSTVSGKEARAPAYALQTVPEVAVALTGLVALVLTWLREWSGSAPGKC